MSGKHWFAVDAIVSPDAGDAAEEALAMVADLGTSRDVMKNANGAPVCVSGFFSSQPEIEDVRYSLDAIFTVHSIPVDACLDIKVRTVDDADWLAEWKRHWRPQEIGQFVVSPPWLDPGPTDKLIILIEPNMAFGTGTHETTQLCLEAIGELHTPDQSVMDIGTGTGILSIATAKLGCRQITACDTDADAVAIARQNARLNAVDDLIAFFDGSVDENSPFADLVVANLTIDVILPMLPLLIKITRRHLLLSGILGEQEPLITGALAEGSDLKFEIRHKGEWIAVIVSFPAS